jgi:N-acetylglucosamine-6-phosphate deacetylase
MDLVISNATICNPEGCAQGDVHIRDGVIKRVGPGRDRGHEQVDASGRLLLPGFIDLHIQGAGGKDMLDAGSDALSVISQTCARYGVTGFLGTTVFYPATGNAHLIAAIEQSRQEFKGAHFLGLHLEGPFIAPQRKGMINPEAICNPSTEVLKEILSMTGDNLRMMTIAPELEGALGIIGELKGRGVVASFGHSAATYEQTILGIKAGITHVTHLFNAMNSIHHRAPGPLPAIFESRGVSAQIISDGVHLAPVVVRLAASLLGMDRCVLITDGMQALGLGDGSYSYDGRRYESREGTARYGDGTLIGTALGINQLAGRFRKFTGCSLSAIARVTSWNPAKVLGLTDRKGSIDPGKDADLVLLDDDLSVWKTIVSGRMAFESHSEN